MCIWCFIGLSIPNDWFSLTPTHRDRLLDKYETWLWAFIHKTFVDNSKNETFNWSLPLPSMGLQHDLRKSHQLIRSAQAFLWRKFVGPSHLCTLYGMLGVFSNLHLSSIKHYNYILLLIGSPPPLPLSLCLPQLNTWRFLSISQSYTETLFFKSRAVEGSHIVFLNIQVPPWRPQSLECVGHKAHCSILQTKQNLLVLTLLANKNQYLWLSQMSIEILEIKG